MKHLDKVLIVVVICFDLFNFILAILSYNHSGIFGWFCAIVAQIALAFSMAESNNWKRAYLLLRDR